MTSVFQSSSPDPAAFGTALAELGRESPTVFDEYMGAPLVLRHKDVSAALRNHATFSTKMYAVGPMTTAMITQDGTEHTKQRRIHNKFFSPAASARYKARIAPIAERAFGALTGRDSAELIEDVVARYPMEVFLDLLGIPNDLGDQGLEWVRAIVGWMASPMNTDLAGPGQRAFDELSSYTATLIEQNPRDNLLGEIIEAHLSEGRFSVEACTVAVISLLLGGLETTIQMLSATIAALLLNPQALAQVNADPELRDAAVDEAFRWANPTAGLYRAAAVRRRDRRHHVPGRQPHLPVHRRGPLRRERVPAAGGLRPPAGGPVTSGSAWDRTTAPVPRWPASRSVPRWTPCSAGSPGCGSIRPSR
jgi:cytochrome P450